MLEWGLLLPIWTHRPTKWAAATLAEGHSRRSRQHVKELKWAKDQPDRVSNNHQQRRGCKDCRRRKQWGNRNTWVVKLQLNHLPSISQSWCARWDYDRSDWPETVVSQFNLVCDRLDKLENIDFLDFNLHPPWSPGTTCGRCHSRYIWPASWSGPSFQDFFQVPPMFHHHWWWSLSWWI